MFVCCASVFWTSTCQAQPVVNVVATTYSSFAHTVGGQQDFSNNSTPATSAGGGAIVTSGTEHTLVIPAQQQFVSTSSSLSGGWPNNPTGVSGFGNGFQDVVFQVAMPNQPFKWESYFDTGRESTLQTPGAMGSFQIQDNANNVFGYRTIAERVVNPDTGNPEWLVHIETWAGGAWQPVNSSWVPNAQPGVTIFTTPPLQMNFAQGFKVRTVSNVDLLNAVGAFQWWNPSMIQQKSIFTL